MREIHNPKINALIDRLIEETKSGRLKWEVSKCDPTYWTTASNGCNFVVNTKSANPRLAAYYNSDGVYLKVKTDPVENHLVNPLVELLERFDFGSPPPDREERLDHLLASLKNGQ